MPTTTYDKPFKTYDEMISILKSRHIQISDLSFAKMALENFSYYSLINGYKDTFLQISGSDDFIEGTLFEELYTLHIIDTNINSVLFKYILYIERALKSRISYLVSENYGVYTDRNDKHNRNSSDYLYKKNYSNSTGKRDSILEKLKASTENKRNNASLEHYIQTKNHIPAWILTGNIPFGLAIEWYSILKGVDKSVICSKFIGTHALTIDERKEFLLKALDLVKEYRNRIAHGNRTFSIMQLPILPKKATLLLSYGALSESEYNSRLGQNDIFAVFLVVMILINDHYLISNFYNDCRSIFTPYENTKINGKTIYEIFGLPSDVLERMMKIFNARFT